jgi:two-component system, OmpR family, sensor kinase
MSRLSLRARLVLGVLAVAAVALVAADAATYASLRSFLLERVDSSLDDDHRAVSGFLSRGGFDRGPGRDGGPTPDVVVQVRSGTGEVLYDSGVPHFPGTTAPPGPSLPAAITVPAASDPRLERVRHFTVPAVSGDGRYRARASIAPGAAETLIVATSLADVDGTLRRLLLIELLVTGAVIAAIILLGLWIVRIGLRPLEAIGKTADAIAAGDLSRRVERAEERTEVGRLGLALNAMLARIEESDRRLRRFVADASHELRTPLSAVRAYAELFERGAERRPEDLKRAMSGIGRESERMSDLVEDLLLLARLDEGRPLERQPVRLDDLAGEAVETARTLDGSHPLELAAVPTTVLGDRTALRQVLDNLLGNVRSHTPEGTRARVQVSHDGAAAVLEVADEGPGLEAEQAERVFERFYRADPSRSRDSGGSGLGLSIVAAVTKAHGGSASVRTGPGRGTTIRITLPLFRRPGS